MFMLMLMAEYVYRGDDWRTTVRSAISQRQADSCASC